MVSFRFFHIDVKNGIVRDVIEEGLVHIVYCRSEYQHAGIRMNAKAPLNEVDEVVTNTAYSDSDEADADNFWVRKNQLTTPPLG